MTFQAAINFFAHYGNVSREELELSSTPPTERQLSDAVDYAIRVKAQSSETANQARLTVLNHFYDQGSR